jgi:hypothetical protein
MLTFADKYSQLASRYYRELLPEDGISETEISSCERRVGLRLPSALRDVYLLTGNIDAINRTYDRLLEPDAIWVDEGFIVFYEENQRVVFWGISGITSNCEDPPVYQAVNDSMLEWNQEFSFLSDFLFHQFYWQAVNGALPKGGIASIDEELLKTIMRYWPADSLMKGSNNSGVNVFCRDGQILCVSGEPPNLTLQAAARDENEFSNIKGILRLKWDGVW